MFETPKETPVDQNSPFDVLTEGEFDPDEARRLVEAARSKQQGYAEEKTENEQEFHGEHQGNFQNFKRIAEELVASDSDNSSKEDLRNRTRLFCGIVGAEYSRRFIKKKYEYRNEELIDDKLQKLEEGYRSRGPIGRFFGRSDYESQKSSLEFARRSTPELADTHHQEQQIAEKLPEYYGEEVKNKDGEIDTEKLQKLNDRFFGKDDPTRAEKIELAITEFGLTDVITMDGWIKSLEAPSQNS